MLAGVLACATSWSQAEAPVAPLAQTPSGPAGPLDFQTDLFTGRFTYGVPIELPPGRGSSRPFVALSYDSSGGNGICGVGWQLPLSSIQRDGTHGVPIKWVTGGALNEYDDDKGFVFSFQGTSSRLVHTGGTPTAQEYRPLVDRTYLRFIYHDSLYWEVLDKEGGHHFFGRQSTSRMENTRFPANLGKSTYRWAIDLSRDVHGYETQYTYQKEGNLLYPFVIDYGARSSPWASLPNACRVQFSFQPRILDNSFSYSAGYRIETNQRLSMIVVSLMPPNAPVQTIRSYVIDYVDSPSSKRALISSITPLGTQGTPLSALTFQYNEKPLAFDAPVPWGALQSDLASQDNNSWFWRTPTARTEDDTPRTHVDLIDIDSDGLPDRVTTKFSTPQFNSYFVQFNAGTAFSGVTRYWGPLFSHPNFNPEYWHSVGLTNSGNDTLMALLDIDGDHRLDRVMHDPAGDQFEIQRNYGSGFSGLSSWMTLTPDTDDDTNWSSITGREADVHGNVATYVDLIDMNADGLPDRVVRAYESPFNKFQVQFNDGAGFPEGLMAWPNVQSEDPNYTYWSYVGYSDYDADTRAGLWDLNGDGLPDRVMRTAADQYTGRLKVQFNNGSGFEDLVDWDIYSPNPNDLSWSCPAASSHEDAQTMIADLNGDGLADRILRQFSGFTKLLVQYNNGHGFLPYQFLPDQEWAIDTQGTPDMDWGSPIEVASSQTRVTLVDINGDGLLDRVMRRKNAPYDTFLVQLNKGPAPDLMKKIGNASGGGIEVTYKPSTRYDNRDRAWTGNPWSTGAISLLAFPVQTVETVKSDDGLGHTSTLTYDYKHGWFDTVTREFRGFREASVTDPLGTKRTTWFHQGGGFDQSSDGEYQDTEEAKKGIPFRTEVEGLVQGNLRLFKRTLNKVDVIKPVPDTGWRFPFISQTVEIDCEGNTSGQYRAVAKRYEYDAATLNLKKESAFGKVTLSSLTDVNAPNAVTIVCNTDNPCSYTHFIYAALSNSNILTRPSQVLLSSDDPPTTPGRLRESDYTYDQITGDALTRSDWRDVPAGWVTETYDYDDYGNLEHTINHVGVTTTMEADQVYHQFPFSTTVVVDHAPPQNDTTFTTTFDVDPRSGQVESQIDPNGIFTESDFDEFLRRTETRITPPGSTAVWKERFSYNIQSSLNGASRTYVRHRANDGVDATNGHESYTYFDGLGRLIQTRSESETGTDAWRVTDQTYDARGNPSQHPQAYFSTGILHTATPPGTPTSSITYDAIGRVSSTIPVAGDPGSPTAPETIAYEQATFQPAYWSTIRTDATGSICEVRRNAFGWTTYVSRHGTTVDSNSTFSYDRLGNITTIALDANPAHAITMAYDSLGRKLSGIDPDMGYWTYSYDDASQLVQQIDAKGQKIKYFYDELGRTTKKELYFSGSNTPRVVTYVYDWNEGDSLYTVGKGQVFKVVDSEGWEKNSYDNRGRLLKRTRFVTKNNTSYTISFGYNDADKVTDVYYPKDPGFQQIGGPSLMPRVRNVYDTGGNLSRIDRIINASSQETLYTATGFDSLGQLTGITFGNGVQTSFTYHTNTRRLKQTQTFGPGQVPLQSLVYTYDAVADLVKVDDGVNTGTASAEFQGVLYDDLHRLTQYTRSGQMKTFSYLANGNFVKNGEMGTRTYVHDPIHLHQVTSANFKSYAYDANGNMTQRDTQTLTWNEENRLSSVGLGSSTVTFGYAHDGSRLWRDNSSAVSVWISTLYEVRAGKRLCHVFAGGRRVCTFELFAANSPPPPSSPSYDPVYYYYHGDHLGSTSVLTDRLGGRVQHHEYGAYGKSTYDLNTLAFPLSNRFTGHVLDADAGLYYCNARYYDPELGRFVQADHFLPDMKDPQSFNRYTYALGNPLRYTDPSGNNPFLIILIGGILGGASAQMQGGDFFEGFVQGGIGAGIGSTFGQFGWLQRAEAGAALAQVQGGNPLMGAIGGALTPAEPPDVMAASQVSMADAFTKLGHFAGNHIAQMALNSAAAHYGIDREMLSTGMQGGSWVGNQIASRFHFYEVGPDGETPVKGSDKEAYLGRSDPGIAGIFTRGTWMAPFDLIDIGLAVQGLPTASANELREYMSTHDVNTTKVWGHSLGAWDVANLAARGVVKNPTLMALPFGMMATWSSKVYLSSCDIVTGFGLNQILNPWAILAPTKGGPFKSHAQEKYHEHVP